MEGELISIGLDLYDKNVTLKGLELTKSTDIVMVSSTQVC